MYRQTLGWTDGPADQLIMKARVETREQSRNPSLNDIVQYMYNYALLELVQGRFRH